MTRRRSDEARAPGSTRSSALRLVPEPGGDAVVHPATSTETIGGPAGSDVTKMVLHIKGSDEGITVTVGAGIWNDWWPSTNADGDFLQTATVNERRPL